MNKKLIAFFFGLLAFLLLAPTHFVGAVGVFWDDFSSGSFAGWTAVNASLGSSQTVTNGVARFTVPAPIGGEVTYSSVIKDGFFCSVNSTIIAEQEVNVTLVPWGCPRGNGAIFFFYVCDSTDLGGGNGNFGVGIDGSGMWSLWIGGPTEYSYVFQTAGLPPVSNTWYHITLTVNNSAGTVLLAVNNQMVISAEQQEFTDKTHPITLMSGIGENWWSAGPRQIEVDVDNVKLDISDADPAFLPTLDPPVPEFSILLPVLILVLFIGVLLDSIHFFRKKQKKGC